MITDGSAAMYTKDFYKQVGKLSRHTRNINGMLDFITKQRDQDAIDLIALLATSERCSKYATIHK